MCREDIYGLFAGRLRNLLREAIPDPEALQEVRLRAERPLLVLYDGEEYGVSGEGRLIRSAREGCRVTADELREALEYLCGYSLYAFDEELKQGFLTVPGGHRVGVSGKIVMENGRVQCVRHISCLNIRLSHQICGCADAALPYLISDGEVCHTLIVSPPRCGKTTLLRDLIRQISDGTACLAGRTVGVVDERAELAGAYLGIPQNDLGMRTDVLEGCPKAAGMMMLLRSMSPQVIAVDEIGSEEDGYALENVFRCGCRLIATVHGTSLEDIHRKPLLHRLAEGNLFERYIILGGDPPGRIREICDSDGACLFAGQRKESVPCG